MQCMSSSSRIISEMLLKFIKKSMIISIYIHSLIILSLFVLEDTLSVLNWPNVTWADPDTHKPRQWKTSPSPNFLSNILQEAQRNVFIVAHSRTPVTVSVCPSPPNSKRRETHQHQGNLYCYIPIMFAKHDEHVKLICILTFHKRCNIYFASDCPETSPADDIIPLLPLFVTVGRS